jgi:hypothetical protein
MKRLQYHCLLAHWWYQDYVVDESIEGYMSSCDLAIYATTTLCRCTWLTAVPGHIDDDGTHAHYPWSGQLRMWDLLFSYSLGLIERQLQDDITLFFATVCEPEAAVWKRQVNNQLHAFFDWSIVSFTISQRAKFPSNRRLLKRTCVDNVRLHLQIDSEIQTTSP